MMAVINKLKEIRYDPENGQPHEHLALITRDEANLLKSFGGLGKMTKFGVRSYTDPSQSQGNNLKSTPTKTTSESQAGQSNHESNDNTNNDNTDGGGVQNSYSGYSGGYGSYGSYGAATGGGIGNGNSESYSGGSGGFGGDNGGHITGTVGNSYTPGETPQSWNAPGPVYHWGQDSGGDGSSGSSVNSDYTSNPNSGGSTVEKGMNYSSADYRMAGYGQYPSGQLSATGQNQLQDASYNPPPADSAGPRVFSPDPAVAVATFLSPAAFSSGKKDQSKIQQTIADSTINNYKAYGRGQKLARDETLVIDPYPNSKAQVALVNGYKDYPSGARAPAAATQVATSAPAPAPQTPVPVASEAPTQVAMAAVPVASTVPTQVVTAAPAQTTSTPASAATPTGAAYPGGDGITSADQGGVFTPYGGAVVSPPQPVQAAQPDSSQAQAPIADSMAPLKFAAMAPSGATASSGATFVGSHGGSSFGGANAGPQNGAVVSASNSSGTTASTAPATVPVPDYRQKMLASMSDSDRKYFLSMLTDAVKNGYAPASILEGWPV